MCQACPRYEITDLQIVMLGMSKVGEARPVDVLGISKVGDNGPDDSDAKPV